MQIYPIRWKTKSTVGKLYCNYFARWIHLYINKKAFLFFLKINTIIFATPIKGFELKKVNGKMVESQTTIEQTIGRILREPPQFRTHIPIVIDIVDNFSNYIKWCYTRNAFYKRVGYPMTRNVVVLNKESEGRQKYNLNFLKNNDIFYASETEIKEAVEGIEREDSSMSSDSNLCMFDD